MQTYYSPCTLVIIYIVGNAMQSMEALTLKKHNLVLIDLCCYIYTFTLSVRSMLFKLCMFSIVPYLDSTILVL